MNVQKGHLVLLLTEFENSSMDTHSSPQKKTNALTVDRLFASGASESAITDMQAYMDMLNPDISSDTPKNENKTDSKTPPPPPTYPPPPPPPPPPPQCPPTPPPPPSYPAPKPPKEPSSAEFLKVKSNLRHVESNTGKKKVRTGEVLLDLTISVCPV